MHHSISERILKIEALVFEFIHYKKPQIFSPYNISIDYYFSHIAIFDKILLSDYLHIYMLTVGGGGLVSYLKA